MLTNKLLAAIGIAGALVLGVAGSAEARGWRGGGFHHAPVFHRSPVYGGPMHRPVYRTPVYSPMYSAPVYGPVYSAPVYAPVYHRPMWTRMHRPFIHRY
jgi:hypothetical protein